MTARRLMQQPSANRRMTTGHYRVSFHDPFDSGLNGTRKTHRPLLPIATLVVIILAAVQPIEAQEVCSVPGSHSSIQSAVDDPRCALVGIGGTNQESVQISRTVWVGGPPEKATIEGLLKVVGAETEVRLGNIIVENGCLPTAMRISGGALVWTLDDDLIEVRRVDGGPCPPLLIFEDGFESGNTSAWSSSVP